MGDNRTIEQVVTDMDTEERITNNALDNGTQMIDYFRLMGSFTDSCLDNMEAERPNINLTQKCGIVYHGFNQQMENLLSKHKATFDEVLYGIAQ
jgi:hypothetical protein